MSVKVGQYAVVNCSRSVSIGRGILPALAVFSALTLPFAASAEPREYLYLNTVHAHAITVMSKAQRGDASAEFELALMYDRGQVVAENHKEAVKWMRLAAEQDYAPAQVFLGFMYASGKGVLQDFGEALRLLNLAADQGNTTAQFYLGGVYFTGVGGKVDYIQAYKWFSLANPKDNPDGERALANVAAKMTPLQIAIAQRLAREWAPANK